MLYSKVFSTSGEVCCTVRFSPLSTSFGKVDKYDQGHIMDLDYGMAE